MLYAGDVYRFFTSFRMTRLRFVVILSGAKDLYESNTINIKLMLLHHCKGGIAFPFMEKVAAPQALIDEVATRQGTTI